MNIKKNTFHVIMLTLFAFSSASYGAAVREVFLPSSPEEAREESQIDFLVLCANIKKPTNLPVSIVQIIAGLRSNKHRMVPEKTLEGHTGEVISLEPLEGNRLASGSADTTVRVWDLRQGECTHVLEGHTDKVTALAALDDGRLASGSDDKTVRVWGLDSIKGTHVLKGHTDKVIGLAALKGGRLASCSLDDTVRIWDFKKKTVCTHTFRDNTGPIHDLLVWEDELLVSAHGFGVSVWDLEKGKHKLDLRTHSVFSLAALKGSFLILGASDGMMEVWDVEKNEHAKTLSHFGGRQVHRLCILDDAVASLGRDEDVIRIQAIENGRSLQKLRLENSPNGTFTALAKLCDESLAIGAADSNVYVWGPGKKRKYDEKLEPKDSKGWCSVS